MSVLNHGVGKKDIKRNYSLCEKCNEYKMRPGFGNQADCHCNEQNRKQVFTDPFFYIYIMHGDMAYEQRTECPQEVPCTHFLPSSTPASSIKKWIAHSDGFCKGEIHLDSEATRTLLDGKIASILPVGITHIEGEFDKDDIVRITGADGTHIGIGRVSCDARTARDECGCKDRKPIVHYDFLFIE